MIKIPEGLISEELKAERLAVCRTCPAYKLSRLDPSLGLAEWFGIDLTIEQPTCGEFGRPITDISCGCLLNLKAKISIFKCPQKKWKQ